ncbi:MAG: sulfotransferase domain-containing protein [Synechococcaceae cyanobacterium SM2_3_1]|nr:sulfotransferase domain-containing protein [Synechococcaceae cyanobacterium SM2_3_1]
MNLIACAGLPRSGSTWLYNVVRLLLSTDGASVSGAFIDKYDSSDPAEIHVIKTHEFKPWLAEQANLILASRRDLRDIVASLIRKRWISPAQAIDYIGPYVQHYEFWRSIAVYELVYESMIEDQLQEILTLSEILGVECNSQILERICEAVAAIGQSERQIGSGWDQETLIHPQHITDGRAGSYQETLDSDLISSINYNFGDWLKYYGYLS